MCKLSAVCLHSQCGLSTLASLGGIDSLRNHRSPHRSTSRVDRCPLYLSTQPVHGPELLQGCLLLHSCFLTSSPVTQVCAQFRQLVSDVLQVQSSRRVGVETGSCQAPRRCSILTQIYLLTTQWTQHLCHPSMAATCKLSRYAHQMIGYYPYLVALVF